MFGKKNKLTRKMKRRIRKTTAVVLLLTSIVVAAIPVPEAAASTAGASDTIVGTKSDYNSAGSTEGSITATKTSIIPVLQNVKVFTSMDDIYQFAYGNIPGEGGGDKAVLLGASANAIQNGGQVAIPETVDAYVQYASNGGYAAANKDGQWLYYKTLTKVTAVRTGTIDSSGTENWNSGAASTETDVGVDTGQAVTASLSAVNGPPAGDSGSISQTLEFYRYKFNVCYMNNKDKWYGAVNGNGDNLYRLVNQNQSNVTNLENYNYYIMPASYNAADFGLTEGDLTAHKESTDFAKVTTTDTWLHDVKVGCISSQRAELVDGKWQLAANTTTNGNTSFFANAPAITNISLPNELCAVAPGTFSSCTNLESVTFTEKIREIGAAAFKDCTRLSTVNLPSNAGITEIAENTFENCQSLKNFTFPTAVTKLGNESFKGCTALSGLTFSNTPLVTDFGRNVFENCTALKDVVLPESLTNMGYGTFKGCSSLAHVTLPKTNTLTLRFSAFEGCTGLEWIDVLNYQTTFEKPGQGEAGRYPYDVDQFKNDVGEDFYFIGEDKSCGIHQNITSNHEIAFQYRGNGNYEKIIIGSDKNNNPVKYTYLVNAQGALLGIDIPTGAAIDSVVIASQVGPHKITSIGSEFSDGGKGNINLKSITIPRTITTIGADAFKGCSNLEKVIFEEDNQITSIGQDAFYTQYGAENTVKELTFEGKIDVNSVPFQYAMNNKINNDKQPDTYIDFSSGSPTYIHVKYNPGTQKREVWKVPTVTDPEYRDAVEEALKASPVVSGNNPGASGSNSGMSAVEVIKAYQDSLDGNGSISLAESVEKVVKAAYYIELPTGIQAIKKGLFSSANDDNTKSSDGVKENAAKIPTTDINRDIRGITMYDVESLDDYAFYGCEKLKTVEMYSSGVGESIGKYAFGQCEELENVTLPTTTSAMGIRPFANDQKVAAVYFAGEGTQGRTAGTTYGSNFSSDKGIIYEGANGQKGAIVQCLPARGELVGSRQVGEEDLGGVNEIYPEAFMGCSRISKVDLSKTNVETIPEFAFANAAKLTDFYLPVSCGRLDDYALKDTDLAVFDVPNSNVMFGNNTIFNDSEASGNILHKVEVICAEGSSAAKLAKTYEKYGWTISDKRPSTYYTITFYDDDGRTKIAEKTAKEGDVVEPPTAADMAPYLAKHAGMKYYSWKPGDFSPATVDLSVVAQYTAQTWTVTFVNDNMKQLAVRTVPDGGGCRRAENADFL